MNRAAAWRAQRVRGQHPAPKILQIGSTNGISFGGVVAFLFADLLVLPVANIYRKYHVSRMALLFGLFYVAIAAAGYVIEILFGLLGLVPAQRGAVVLEAQIQWNDTAVLNILALALSAMLVWRFLGTGGPKMLRMMAVPSGKGHGDHSHAHDHG